MASPLTSPRLADVFALESLILRKDLQQDKKTALLALARLFDDHQVPYVVVGGLAVQLYTPQPRLTMDLDVVSIRALFEPLRKTQPWAGYGFELVFDHRRHIKIKHIVSNVEVDINVDTRFARAADAPVIEHVDGYPIPFCTPARLAVTKLRTQRSDWPRDLGKRLQDRTDLVKILQMHPEIADEVRADPYCNDEMRAILDEICRELNQCPSPPGNDDFPVFDDDSDDDSGS